jgi:hypothetical protein
MIPFPKEFDQNEWFILVFLITNGFALIFLPKRFPKIITLLILLFGLSVPRILDHLLSANQVDLYDLMDTPKLDLFDILLYFIIAPFSYYFIYFYDKLNVRGIGISVYVLIWSLAGVGYESLAVQFEVFTYNTWKLGYSFPFYIMMQIGLILYYRIIQRSLIRTQKSL